MIDGVVKDEIEQAIRFLVPGARYDVEVNNHAMLVVRLKHLSGRFYLIACTTCESLLCDSSGRPFHHIHNHTKLEDKTT